MIVGFSLRGSSPTTLSVSNALNPLSNYFMFKGKSVFVLSFFTVRTLALLLLQFAEFKGLLKAKYI